MNKWQVNIKVWHMPPIQLNDYESFIFQYVGGELGGKNPFIKWGSSITLFLMWVIYIVLASLKAYDILDWEVWSNEY